MLTWLLLLSSLLVVALFLLLLLSWLLLKFLLLVLLTWLSSSFSPVVAFPQWYDPSTDCWTDSGELFDLPYKRLRYCAATVETDGRMFIFGGQAVDETDSEVYSIEDTVNWYQVWVTGRAG